MLARFVVNPRAARVPHASLEEVLREEFPDWDLRLGADLATGDPDARPDLVVAVGGDGTVHRLLDQLRGRAVPLGILPCGRANDFARALGLPRDLRRACAVLRDGAVADIDLVSVNGRPLATCGGLGLVASVSARANGWRSRAGLGARVARRLGSAVYAAAMGLEIAGGWTPVTARITSPEGSHEARLAAFLVSNQPRFGGRLCVSPRASNRDGHLHLCEIRSPRRRWRMLGIGVCAWTRGLGDAPEITRTLVREAEISTERDQFFYGDGEPVAWGRRFCLRAEPAALRVIVPRRARPVPALREADDAA